MISVLLKHLNCEKWDGGLRHIDAKCGLIKDQRRGGIVGVMLESETPSAQLNGIRIVLSL